MDRLAVIGKVRSRICSVRLLDRVQKSILTSVWSPEPPRPLVFKHPVLCFDECGRSTTRSERLPLDSRLSRSIRGQTQN